jgi:hypothetical protein
VGVSFLLRVFVKYFTKIVLFLAFKIQPSGLEPSRGWWISFSLFRWTLLVNGGREHFSPSTSYQFPFLHVHSKLNIQQKSACGKQEPGLVHE